MTARSQFVRLLPEGLGEAVELGCLGGAEIERRGKNLGKSCSPGPGDKIPSWLTIT